MKCSVGFDLGGTKLAAALVRSDGQILAFHKESILELKKNNSPRIGQKKIISLMGDMLTSFRAQHPQSFSKKNFVGVGLASAGPLDVETGNLINPVNFPGWKTVPIQKMLSDELKKIKFSTRVFFQNDAIAAAFAEAWIGGAKGLSSYAVVTVGTGIGTGVIFKNKPVQTHGMGSEFGHLIAENHKIRNPKEELHFYTVEGLASGTGILRRAKDLGFQGKNIEELVSDFEDGNQKYQILFDDAADALAALCYNLSIGFNPDKILFSGGLIKIRHLYFSRLKARYLQLINTFNSSFKTPIQVAKCLNQAGVIGAAYLPFYESLEGL